MNREKNIKNYILNYIYATSKQPILLKDMLVASVQYRNDMEVDSSRLGFRLRLTRAYLVYVWLVLAVLLPISLLTHKLLAKIDAHISIVGGMIITALIFMGFNYFKDIVKKDVVINEIYVNKDEIIFIRFSRRTILRYDLDFIPHNISTFQMIQIQGLTGIASDQ